MRATVVALAVTAATAGSAAAAPALDRPGTVDGWTTASPSSLGLRGRALERGAAEARRLDSTCFAVVRNGRLAGEWNWQERRDVPREVFSITKSVTSTLVGIAIRDGDLRLDDPVSRYVPQWRGTPSESVTVRNLLSNDSGRYWSLQSDYADLLTARSRTRYAVRLPQQYAPGTAWAYNNAAIQVLEPVLEAATGMRVARFAAYGYLWWLNRPGLLRGATDPVDAQGQPVQRVTGQLAAYAPVDVFAALGFGGQVLLVDPGSRTMVVRLGLPAQAGAPSYGFGRAATVLTDALR